MDRRGASPKVPKVARFEKVEQPAAAPEFALSPRSPRSPRSSSACSPRSPRLMLTPRTRARSAPTLCADALEEIHTRFRQEATAAENVEGVADALAQAEHAVLSSMFGAALQRAQHSLKSATCAPWCIETYPNPILTIVKSNRIGILLNHNRWPHAVGSSYFLGTRS